MTGYNKFLNLKALFSKIDNESNNALSSIIEVLKQKDYEGIAHRTNYLLSIVNKDWLTKKLKNFKKQNPKENISALLGEIRCHGEIKLAFKEFEIYYPNTGSDFIINFFGNKIQIETYTPQESRDKKTAECILNEETIHSNYRITLKAKLRAPFGLPKRSKDNTQYEAVSKFSRIKEDKEGKQFSEDAISILWIDLNDPTMFPFSLAEQCQPILTFNGGITSGAIWYAFYGEKGDWIYNDFRFPPCNAVEMEFNGRFKRGTLIDFVIIDAFTEKYIFQNPYSSKKILKEVLPELFSYLFRLFNLQASNSFFDLNLDRLRNFIEFIRIRNNSLYQIYQPTV